MESPSSGCRVCCLPLERDAHNLAKCEFCSRYFHRECVDLKEDPSSDACFVWGCPHCSNPNLYGLWPNLKSPSFTMCGYCNRLYHNLCLKLNKNVMEGDPASWECPKCLMPNIFGICG